MRNGTYDAPEKIRRTPDRPMAAATPSNAPSSAPLSAPSNAPSSKPKIGAGTAAGARHIAGRLLFSILIVFATAVLFGATPLFSITDIEVTGNSYYSRNTIIEKSGLRIGQNGFGAVLGGNALKAFSMRCAAPEKAIVAACPYIKAVQARYVLPRTIRIAVEERDKSVAVPYFGSGLLIDGEGVVVDIVKDYGLSELPVVYGMPVAGYEIGKPLAVDDEWKMDTVMSVVNALKQADRDSDDKLMWSIAAIDVGDPRNVTLFSSSGIDVNLGDCAELYYRVSAVKEIMAHGIDEGEEGTIVFFSGARPVFTPK